MKAWVSAVAATVAFVAVLTLMSAATAEELDTDADADASPSPIVFTEGVDVSTLVTVAQWKCMRERNPVIQHVIVRAFRSTGSSDPNVVQTLRNAIEAGYDKSNLGVYIFPRPLSSAGLIQEGGSQVEKMMNNLINNGAGDYFSSLWLDIEGLDLYWSRVQNNNIKFVEQMMAKALTYRPKYSVGIYTSKSQWGPIMGNNYKGGAGWPLWYAAYNGKVNFNDFEPFAGWANPTIHQYAGDKKVCGVPADVNVMTFGTLKSVADRAPINGGGGVPDRPVINSPACANSRGVCMSVTTTPCVGTVKKGLCPGPASVVCCVQAPVLRSTPGAVAERASTDAPITAEAVDTGVVTWHRSQKRRGARRQMKLGGLMKIRRRKHQQRQKKAKKVKATPARVRED